MTKIIVTRKYFNDNDDIEPKPLLLGKTAEQLLFDSFGGETLEKIDFENHVNESGETQVLLFSEFPFTTADTISNVLDFLESGALEAVDFGGGIAIKPNGKASCAITKQFECGAAYITSEDYPTAREYARKAILKKHLRSGVIIDSLDNVEIDYTVIIESGARVCAFNTIKGATKIGKNAVIGSFCDITDSVIGESVFVRSSTLTSATVGKGTQVGPNAYLRPDAVIGEKCRIGDFVEIKNSVIGDGTKVSHLAYIGDATVGKRCNVGCGVVFVNYDGKTKHRTVVGDDCFLGSNANLIAPITIGDKAFIAAGSTVTVNLDGGDFCVARQREYIKHDWKRKE